MACVKAHTATFQSISLYDQATSLPAPPAPDIATTLVADQLQEPPPSSAEPGQAACTPAPSAPVGTCTIFARQAAKQRFTERQIFEHNCETLGFKSLEAFVDYYNEKGQKPRLSAAHPRSVYAAMREIAREIQEALRDGYEYELSGDGSYKQPVDGHLYLASRHAISCYQAHWNIRYERDWHSGEKVPGGLPKELSSFIRTDGIASEGTLARIAFDSQHGDSPRFAESVMSLLDRPRADDNVTVDPG